MCEEKGYIKPSVYQGCYNLIDRQPEQTLFPLLRKHGMVFNAYRYLPPTNIVYSMLMFVAGRWQAAFYLGERRKEISRTLGSLLAIQYQLCLMVYTTSHVFMLQ